MSILIKGMEMPKGRGEYELRFYVDSDGTSTVEGAYCFLEGEPFEAVPVPPHGRLIDKDAIRKKCERGEYPNVFIDSKELAAEFYAAPTIIPAEEGET